MFDLLDTHIKFIETIANALELLTTPRCREDIARDIDDQV